MAIEICWLQDDSALLPAVAVLMEEMQAHYGVASPSRADIISSLASRPPGTEILVAEEDGLALGFCAFSAIYPGPGLKAGMFLKELYVSGSSRSRGLGRSLMRALAGLARKRGLSRIDWTADAEDDRLLAFYDALGGARKTDKLFYRLDGDALDALGMADAIDTL